ncbi:hypothetical protein [uncultured Methanoregula sp.]|uniref:hypothetical protein n=1 Tax=uncultured Methanoregula sp. TaxID=1005933 RepID=UPI002AABDC3B|nr:hypothetical protein [uncultured Methanoregula sp.]
MKTATGTTRAVHFAPVPVGAAITLVIATPVMNNYPGWPFLASLILAAGFVIPIIAGMGKTY